MPGVRQPGLCRRDQPGRIFGAALSGPADRRRSRWTSREAPECQRENRSVRVHKGTKAAAARRVLRRDSLIDAMENKSQRSFRTAISAYARLQLVVPRSIPITFAWQACLLDFDLGRRDHGGFLAGGQRRKIYLVGTPALVAQQSRPALCRWREHCRAASRWTDRWCPLW